MARYTSAAPMYFTESDNYVDGGVLANNPCIGGLRKIQSFHEERGIYLPITCMVSLGSGISPSHELGSVDMFLRLRFAGMFRRAHDLVSMLSSAVSIWTGVGSTVCTTQLPSCIWTTRAVKSPCTADQISLSHCYTWKSHRLSHQNLPIHQNECIKIRNCQSE